MTTIQSILKYSQTLLLYCLLAAGVVKILQILHPCVISMQVRIINLLGETQLISLIMILGGILDIWPVMYQLEEHLIQENASGPFTF